MSKYISQYDSVTTTQAADYFLLQRGNRYKKILQSDFIDDLETYFGGSDTLSGLTDVDITYLSNGDAPIWNSSTLKWEASSVGSGTLSSLSDVSITSIASGEILQWDGTDWINRTKLEAGLTETGTLTANYIPKATGANTIVNGTIYDASTAYGFIGVTSPSFTFGISGNSARSIGMERHTTANTAGNTFTVQAGGATSGATDKNGGNLLLASGTSTGSGSSGIDFYTVTAGGAGTTDRTQSLKMSLSGAGYLGIAKSSPSYHVDVTGSVNVDAGYYYRIGGDIFAGARGNTAALTTNQNTNIGYGSGATITTGLRNVTVGYLANAIGSGAQTGNVYIGWQAGYSGNSYENVAIGESTMNGITSGNSNTAVGRGALSGLTTQNKTIAIGYGCNIGGSAGDANLLIGWTAAISSGSYSTHIGYEAGLGTTSGTYNLIMGYRANYVYRATSTDRCTFIGTECGTDTGIGTLIGSTAIGAYRSFVTKSNQLVLGGGSTTSYGFFDEIVLGTSATFSSCAPTMTVTMKVGYSTNGTNTPNGVVTADYAGHSLRLAAGQSTGTGVGGSLILSTTATGASGSTINTLTDRITILGGTGYAGMQGITAPTAFLHLAPSTTAAASLCIPSGTAPTSPVNGDVWTTSLDPFVRITGVTRTIKTDSLIVDSGASLAMSNVYNHFVFTGGSATTWTMFALSGNTNKQIIIHNRGTATITLNSNAGATDFNNLGTAVNTKSILAGETFTLYNDGTYYIIY